MTKKENKPQFKEIIVVEGRDDTAAINRAVSATTIETHGYGISKKTWDLIASAYETRGIIIFTDPDFAGNQIRKRIKEKFPDAKEAFLKRKDAEKAMDIGIENAEPEAIIAALEKAKASKIDREDCFTKQDMISDGLSGDQAAFEKREILGKILGIGGGNTKAFLKKLNGFGITREEYNEALRTIDNKGN